MEIRLFTMIILPLGMTKEQLINYVPEYLNVHIDKEAYIQGSDNFQVGIIITYK